MPEYRTRRFNASTARAGRHNNNRSGGRPRSKGPKKDNIHPSRFIKVAKPVAAETYNPTHEFADFAIADLLKDNLAKRGFVTPSPIQDQSIPVGLSGKDVIGIANTGTGKTAAFAIPIIDKLMRDDLSRALILAPTRELVNQIAESLKVFTKKSPLKITTVVGGASANKPYCDGAHNRCAFDGTLA